MLTAPLQPCSLLPVMAQQLQHARATRRPSPTWWRLPVLVWLQVSCNQRGRNASQLNLAGTGLGSFNDRFRDSIVGGSPFGPVQFQGFASGLATQPSAFTKAHDA